MFITEGLDHLDMKDQLKNIVTVDEYAAKMGDDADIVTLTFSVNSKLVADDLVTWFERGYDFVLDASTSEGEIDTGKWLVFVEMERRSRVPERICKLLVDLETLTDLSLSDWKVDIEGSETDAEEQRIKELMILNPNEYRSIKGDSDEETNDETVDSSDEDDTELNEYRELSGINVSRPYKEDEYIKNLKAMAGM